jgi:hypothetical protein
MRYEWSPWVCLIIVVILMTLASLGIAVSRTVALTEWSKVCVEGVSYLKFPSGVVVQRDVNDHIVPCKG